jgi:DNA polymerase-3 subunit delta'
VLEPALAPRARPSHAYLITGPGGAGKSALARALAAVLLSEGAPDPVSAAARVRRGAHPDLNWVAPSGAAEMLVSDIDEAVVAAASRTPFEARRRVFVIERADAMNEQAANRMLKTLEEPPAHAHLLLLTDRPADLLPTIVSRCQTVRLSAPSSERIAERLRAAAVPEEQALACARLSLGDADRALQMAVGEGPALRAAAEALARAALAGDVSGRPWEALLERARRQGEQAVGELEAQLAAEGELLAQRERRRHEREGAERIRRAARRAQTRSLDHGLALVGLWFRDVAAVGAEAEEVVHAVDRLDALREDASDSDPHRLRAAVDAVEDTRQRLALNVSEELACEALAFRLVRELAGG